VSSATPRRDNGLHATSYERIVDVETHLVDGLLDRLRDEHVAAYSAPAPGRRGPYGETALPNAPSDSVYVDSGRRDRARVVVDRYLEEVAADIAWAGIVADFDREPSDGVPVWPASEDVDEPSSSDSAPEPTDVVVSRTPPPRARREDDEDHFEPPPPPPLPQADAVTRLAWAGALGGPLLLVLAAIAGIPLSGWVGFLTVAAFVAGFVTLVARMKDRPPTDSGPDDGAVV
jgi:hypothetical protein